MEKLIRILHEGGYSCVIENHGEIRTFTRRGVADLYGLLKGEPGFLKGASVADKVVGKAAASLMILGGVRRLYTDVVSEPALELLRGTNMETDYRRIAPFIRNRDQSGWCPLETVCRDVDTASGCLFLIEDFISKLPH